MEFDLVTNVDLPPSPGLVSPSFKKVKTKNVKLFQNLKHTNMEKVERQQEFYFVIGYYIKPRKGDGTMTKRRVFSIISATSAFIANIEFRSLYEDVIIEKTQLL